MKNTTRPFSFLFATLAVAGCAFTSQAGEFIDTLNADPRRVDASPFATGGDVILKISAYEYVHVFHRPDVAAEFKPSCDLKADVLVLGGGGAGGCVHGGGGGGGGFVSRNGLAFANGETCAVKVGAGGVALGRRPQGEDDPCGGNGGATTFGEITAFGGGGGGGNWHPGRDGASSGGGSGEGNTEAGVIPEECEGQGNLGVRGCRESGGGGGGAGAEAVPCTEDVKVSNGGDGAMSSILGDGERYFGGGGGGGLYVRRHPALLAGRGGLGGGADGGFNTIPAPGEDGLGGGGGGGDSGGMFLGSAGGSGLVAVRYFVAPKDAPLSLVSAGVSDEAVRVRVVSTDDEGSNLALRYGYAADDLTAGRLTAEYVTGVRGFRLPTQPGRTYFYSATGEDIEGEPVTGSFKSRPIVTGVPARVVGDGDVVAYRIDALPDDDATVEFQFWMGETPTNMVCRKTWTKEGLRPGIAKVWGVLKPEEAGSARWFRVRVVTTIGAHVFVCETKVGVSTFLDDAPYCWNPDVTEGRWSDPASWLKSEGILSTLPSVKSVASFDRCKPGVEYRIVIDAPAEVARLSSRAPGQRLVFTGERGVALKAAQDLVQGDSSNIFERISWDGCGNEAEPAAGCVYALRDGAKVTLSKFTSRKDNTLYIGPDCMVTLKGNAQDGGAKRLIVDDGTFVLPGFVGQNHGGGVEEFVVKGKKAKLVFTGRETYVNNNWKAVRFVFEIPEGGYDDVPVRCENESGAFLAMSNPNNLRKSTFCSGEPGMGLVFEVAPTSPILKSPLAKPVEQELFRWNESGWARDVVNEDPNLQFDVHDYTYLSAPEASAGTCAAKLFLRGLDGNDYPDAATLKAASTIARGVTVKVE